MPIRDNKPWVGDFPRMRLCLCLILFLPALSLAEAKRISHVVKEDETAWFLATVYYGRGSDYVKLLHANHLQRAEDMKEGMEIQIEDPRFDQNQNDFSARYAKLWEARQKALGLAANKDSKVNLPAEQIRRRDTTAQLPFHDVKAEGKGE